MATNTLTTKLRLDGAAWDRGLRRAQRQAQNFGRNLISQVGGALGLAGGLFGANKFFSTDIVESQRASEVFGGGAQGGFRLRAIDESFTRLGLEGDGQAAALTSSFDASLRSALAGDRGAAAALRRQGFAHDRKSLEKLAADPIEGLTRYLVHPPALPETAERFSRQDFQTLGLERIWAAMRTDPDLRKILMEQLAAGPTFTESEAKKVKGLAEGLKGIGVETGRGFEHIAGGTIIDDRSELGKWIKETRANSYYERHKKELRPNE